VKDHPTHCMFIILKHMCAWRLCRRFCQMPAVITPDISTFLSRLFNPSNAELNPICHLLALLGAHHILHVSRIMVKAGCWVVVCRLTWLGRGSALAACAWYRYASYTLAMKISGVGIVKVNCPLIFFHFVVAIVNYITLIPLSY
jgi:hypothetical protein